MRKRNKNVYVRFTEDEYRKLMSRIKRTGLSIQSYMVKASLGGKIYGADTYAEFKGISDSLRDMDYQIRKIGTNINQIIRLANKAKNVEEYEELFDYLRKVCEFRREAYHTWQLLRLSLEEKPTGPSADA